MHTLDDFVKLYLNTAQLLLIAFDDVHCKRITTNYDTKSIHRFTIKVSNLIKLDVLVETGLSDRNVTDYCFDRSMDPHDAVYFEAQLRTLSHQSTGQINGELH